MYAPVCHVADDMSVKLPYAACSVTPLKKMFSEPGSTTLLPPVPCVYAAGFGVRREVACEAPSASKSSE